MLQTIAEQLKSKTLEQVVADWNGQLDELVKQFNQQALKVAEWDRYLRYNADRIVELHAEAQRAHAAQNELEEGVSLIEGQQRELAQLLDEVEGEAAKLVESAPGASLTDRDRERGYDMAVTVMAKLEELSTSLQDIVGRVNAAAPAADAQSPAEQIVQVLNAHMSTLQWADQTASSLQARVAEFGSRP